MNQAFLWLALSVVLVSNAGCILPPWSSASATADEEAASEDEAPPKNDRNRSLGRGLRMSTGERGTGVDPQARDIERSLGYKDAGGWF